MATASSCSGMEQNGQHEKLLLTHLLSRMQIAEFSASLTGQWPEFIAQLSNSVENLLLQDYQLNHPSLENESGQLCPTCPPKIFLPVGLVTTRDKHSGRSRQFRFPRRLSELCQAATGARVRGRVPLPALLCRGRLLCRSATLSAWPTGDDSRGSDKMLLDALCVSHIVDLTTESRPLLLPGTDVRMPLWTGELWLNSYADFRRLHLPYPGCDFFDRWPAANGQPLSYDWTGQAATLKINDRLPACATGIAWQQYRSWDLDQLTANYLLLMLGYLLEGRDRTLPSKTEDVDETADSQCSGLLIHCLSGWDRTPLFVCLLRLLLWADGLAHASLSPSEILRLCLAYDWFLWGHRLPDRLAKGQRILEYCFHFASLAADLPHLSAAAHYPHLAGAASRQDVGGSGEGMTRAERLRCVSAMFFGALARSRSPNAEDSIAAAAAAAAGDSGSSVASAAASAVFGALSAALFSDGILP